MAVKHKTSAEPDYILFGAVSALVFLGLVILASASVVLSQENFGGNYYYFTHQLLFGVLLGAGVGILCYRMKIGAWKTYSPFFLIIALFLLILVFTPQFGYGYGGAMRWIRVGAISLQPSEVAKFSFILYLASWLETRRKDITSFSEGLLPLLFITGIVGGLILIQPDISTLGIICLIAATLYFAAGAKFSHIGLMVGAGVSLLFLLIKLAPYRASRLLVYLNPGTDPLGIGYQINQALLAIGSGGISGLGLGHSRQKFNFLPEPLGDSIFAIWAEETGFIGASLVVVLFFILLWRGLRVARNAPDEFSKLVAVGITSWFGFQAFINIAAIIGLIPTTGVPLPFISYGGSSLVMGLAATGLLLNISRHTNRNS